ncbi:MAG: ABC transporter permease [Spirochaetales bacterium]|nr:ABC transporter permease [Spirochaetales bacterium]
MALKILYLDELKGFSRSKVTVALWVGLPVLSVAFRYFRPDAEGLPLLTLVAILLSSIGGTVATVLLSTTITSERGKGVYDLFLVRPVKRRDLLIAKFLAAFSSLFVAVLLSVLLGIVIEALSGNLSSSTFVRQNAESLLMTLTGIAVACSVGVFFGVVMNSVAVSAILAAYLGNQITGALLLPLAFGASLNILVYCALAGVLVPALFLSVSTLIFNRRNG